MPSSIFQVLAGHVKIEIGDEAVDDTMVLAFLLGIEPQSLKALAYRHLGLL